MQKCSFVFTAGFGKKTETENCNKWRGLRRVLTNIMGICEISWPLSSLITAQIGRSSSRLCREHTEYTKMKAWPLLMESRCIAGNWWDPVVSVIWSVHMFLSQLITWNTVMRSIDFEFWSDWLDSRSWFPIWLDSGSCTESSQSRGALDWVELTIGNVHATPLVTLLVAHTARIPPASSLYFYV